MKQSKTLFLAVLAFLLAFACCVPAILKTAPLPVPEKESLISQWMPAGWHEAYEALTQAEKAETDLWLNWFAGKSDEDKQKILYRPYAFGTCQETSIGFLKEQLGPEIVSLLAKNNPDPDSWWVWYASLPEKDSKISQEFVENWLIQFTRMPEEQQMFSNYRLNQWQPNTLEPAAGKLDGKMKELDPAVLQTVKEHVGNPDLWWSYYFLQADRNPELASRDMNWLVWFTNLSADDQAMADQKTHLFFSSQETPGQLG